MNLDTCQRSASLNSDLKLGQSSLGGKYFICCSIGQRSYFSPSVRVFLVFVNQSTKLECISSRQLARNFMGICRMLGTSCVHIGYGTSAQRFDRLAFNGSCDVGDQIGRNDRNIRYIANIVWKYYSSQQIVIQDSILKLFREVAISSSLWPNGFKSG